ncbi:hypothetical protein [Streptomyces sp. CB03911]|uniref:hypothetical protein n=1 Tax=Streptomyces sp. CB03911 TaxID=1804758 RepID=UPI00093A2F90|nr:hypothetical protein [Streptomyces sp. CB03911]OKI14183.1 hypothetical protein A6A07_13610 [Streptomyces sp. CB03911]
MRHTATLALAALLTAGATACSSTPAPPPAAATPTALPPTASPSQPAAAPPAPVPTTAATLDAAAVVAKLHAAVPSVAAGVTITAESDPNKLLGRPGQYTSKVTFTDSRIKAADVDGEDKDSVARGGAVEVFATEADAAARVTYIQGIVKTMPAFLEYDYAQGPVVLRASKQLTPAQVDSIKAALG